MATEPKLEYLALAMRQEWPYLSLERREALMKEEPELVRSLGLKIDDPKSDEHESPEWENPNYSKEDANPEDDELGKPSGMLGDR